MDTLTGITRITLTGNLAQTQVHGRARKWFSSCQTPLDPAQGAETLGWPQHRPGAQKYPQGRGEWKLAPLPSKSTRQSNLPFLLKHASQKLPEQLGHVINSHHTRPQKTCTHALTALLDQAHEWKSP